ncbi:GntR family transcriptional regulator [Actinomadura sp. 9N215]|uniref:GntR family transcriptional regulator n=1 Tax=Actinomadura sp. 9N215 TaxID=3375150 RepID=UPI0037BAC11B
MIEFYLDRGSGVTTYLQLVHQVKRALRLGLLKPGDQLPTAREVVEKLAINPNTVHKAYRDLERDGLVETRPGQGTFVLLSLANPSLSAEPWLRRDLEQWIRRARTAGLQQDDVIALVTAVIRHSFSEGVA